MIRVCSHAGIDNGQAVNSGGDTQRSAQSRNSRNRDCRERSRTAIQKRRKQHGRLGGDLNSGKFRIHEASPVDPSGLASRVPDGVCQTGEVRGCRFGKQICTKKNLVQTQIEPIVISGGGVERSVPFQVRLICTRHRARQPCRCRQCRGVGRRLQFRLDRIDTAEVHSHNH